MDDSHEAPLEAAREHGFEPPPGMAAPTEAHPDVRRFAGMRLREQLAALAAHAPSPGALPDASAVHQLRIATRRIRVWLRLFGRVLSIDDARRINAELRWLARALGAVRDLDVYVERLPEYVAAATGIAAEDLGSYALELHRARARARAALAEVFADPRVAALGGDLARIAASVEADDRGAPGAGVAQFAAARLNKAIKRLRKHGRGVRSDSPVEDLHRLRIEAKRLRYELEFFAAGYPALAAPAKTVKRVQDLLGEFQDACVASASLERYALGAEPPLERRQAFALGRLMQAQVDRASDVRRRFPDAWQEFDQQLKNARKGLAALGHA